MLASPISVYASDPPEVSLTLLNAATNKMNQSGDFLTREEFCVAIARIFFGGQTSTLDITFTDTNEIKPESVPLLAVLVEHGILVGVTDDSDSIHLSMRPNAYVTKQEVYTFLGRVFSLTSDYALTFPDRDMVGSFARGHVAWFLENGLVHIYENATMRPTTSMTVDEVALLIDRLSVYSQRANAEIRTLFGTGSRGQLDGRLNTARFTLPHDVIIGANGAVTVFDTFNNAIRSINDNQVTTTIGGLSALDAGGFSLGFYRDGLLADALFNRPIGGAFDGNGRLYIVDSENHSIRYIHEGSTFTLSGTERGFQNGNVREARFNTPSAIAIDENGNIYVADTLNDCIRKIDTDGNVTTLAGVPNQTGYRNGANNQALFNAPSGIAVSRDGSTVYVADTGNHMIRMIVGGTVSTLAGQEYETDDEGSPLGGFRNGKAEDALFNLPRGIDFANGILIVADSANNMIRVIANGYVYTAVGSGSPGDADGKATGDALNGARGVRYANGNLYIADTLNNKIKIIPFNINH
jgi:DNA-binding beta-propeller fold protein YncE